MRYRLARPADFNPCCGLLQPGFRTSRRVSEELLDIWKKLLLSGEVHFVVFEDQELPYPECIQGFGVTGFAYNDFVEDLLREPRPYISSVVYELALDGRSPLCTPGQIRAAVAGQGMDLIVLHFGYRQPDLTHPKTQEVLMAANAAFYFFHTGYRISSIVQEVYGRDQVVYLENAGFSLLSDFSTYFSLRPDEVPSEPAQPYLMRLKKEHIPPAAVSPLSALFHPLPPRIGFSAAEQRVLERALLNESDDEISTSLGVSPDTVKKTWRRVYERVAGEAPWLLRSSDERSGRSTRGPEKRRHLLEYLRIHLEELRPVAPPRRTTTNTHRAAHGPGDGCQDRDLSLL